MSADVLQITDGSLYPALHKLEQQGWIKAEWRPSENNRRAKFYSLTRRAPTAGTRVAGLDPAFDGDFGRFENKACLEPIS